MIRIWVDTCCSRVGPIITRLELLDSVSGDPLYLLSPHWTTVALRQHSTSPHPFHPARVRVQHKATIIKSTVLKQFVCIQDRNVSSQHLRMVCSKCQKLFKGTTLATPGVKKKTEMYHGSPASSSKSATQGNSGVGKVGLRFSCWSEIVMCLDRSPKVK